MKELQCHLPQEGLHFSLLYVRAKEDQLFFHRHKYMAYIFLVGEQDVLLLKIKLENKSVQNVLLPVLIVIRMKRIN